MHVLRDPFVCVRRKVIVPAYSYPLRDASGITVVVALTIANGSVLFLVVVDPDGRRPTAWDARS